MNKTRNVHGESGASLVELLVVTLVMSFVAAAAFGMITTTMGAQIKLQNRCDSLDAGRKALERMGKVMRMGRQFGPGCNATTMIIQVPKFDDNGFPYWIGAEALETHTFSVVPDPAVNGEFMLQWTKDSGIAVPASTNPAKSTINTSFLTPQILVKGIISPANGQIFRYLNRLDPNNPQSSIVGNNSDYTGATINLEVREHSNSSQDASGNWRKSVVFPYKTEIFMRNNSNMSNNNDLSS